MSPRAPEILRWRLARVRGWLIPAALLALAPKCVLCLLAYAGLGAALGLGGPELCGGTSSPTGPWAAGLGVLAGTAGLGALLARWVKGQSRLRQSSREE